MTLTYASLFDGIGAAHVAWQPMGWQCAWTAEIDAFPSAVVEQRWGFDNLGDVLAIKEEDLDARPAVNVFVGGSPCQSFSVAGKRKGLDDARGNLALRYIQLVNYCRPEWIVWENVPGVLSVNGGRDFGTFIKALADCGYHCCWRVLDAQYFGVPQRRRRVYLVGHLGDWRRSAAVLLERESLQRNPAKGRQARQAAAGAAGGSTDSSGAVCATGRRSHSLTRRHDGSEDGSGRGTPIVYAPDVANCLTRRMHKGINSTVDEGQTPIALGFNWQNGGGYGKANDGLAITNEGTGPLSRSQTPAVVSVQDCSGRDKQQNGKGWSADGIAYTVDAAATQGVCDMAVRRLTPRECERLQGFPDDYTAIEYRGRPAADSPRYKALGNSMAVPVMRWIGERIAMVDAIAKQKGGE